MQQFEFEQYQDASAESSAASQTQSEASTSESQGTETSPAQGSEQTTNTSQTEVPFHEHPRWQELVGQKNQLSEQTREYQRQLQTMQSQLKEMQQAQVAKQRQEDALHARLKQIDPEFGERFSKLDSSLNTLEDIKAWKEQMELQQVRQRGVQMVNDLHQKYKVDDNMRDIYNEAIEAQAARNPQLGLRDLPQVYESVHQKFSKLFDSVKRTERESYVDGKKRDSVPSAPRGKAPQQGGKGYEYSKDPGEAREQLIQNILREAAAEKDL